MNIAVEIITQNYNVTASSVVNEFTIVAEQIITNYNITVASLGEKGEPGKDAEPLILQNLPNLP